VGEIVRYDEYRGSFVDVDVDEEFLDDFDEEEFSDELRSFEDVPPVAEGIRRLD
jgi:hypothetical protein